MKRLKPHKLYLVKKSFENSVRNISTNTYLHSTVTENVKADEWAKAKPYNSIPGPKPLPLIGNIWLFLPFIGPYYKTTFGDISDLMYKKYGKIFRLRAIPGKDFVFITEPNDIETLFRNEGIYPTREIESKTMGHYRKTVRHDVFQGVGGLLTVNGKDWQDIRSKVNPILLRPQNMIQYIEGIDSIANDLLTKIRHFAKLNSNREMPDDFMNTMYSWALENAAYIAVDKRLGCLNLNLEDNSEPLKIIQCIVESFTLFEELEFQPTLRNIYKTKKWKRFVEIVDYLTYTFLKFVKESESKMTDSRGEHMSVLQQLLKVDRKVAIATTMDTLFAGVDTTSKQITNALYYIAKNQKAQDSLRKELFSLLPHKDTPITKDILLQASYLRAAIKEAERIAPIARGNLRHTVIDIVLSGYQVPKGTNVLACNEIASKLSKNYPQPLEFLPERWLRTTTGELSHKNTNPFVTLPFGFGTRSCVGRRIASLEMEITMAKMIRNFRVMWHYKEPTFDGAPFVGIVDPLKFQFNELEN